MMCQAALRRSLGMSERSASLSTGLAWAQIAADVAILLLAEKHIALITVVTLTLTAAVVAVARRLLCQRHQRLRHVLQAALTGDARLVVQVGRHGL